MASERVCIGIDVAAETVCAAALGGSSRSFANAPAGYRALWQWARNKAAGSPLHFCLEATGVYSIALAQALQARGRRVKTAVTVSVLNPAQSKAYGKARLGRTKTDAADAQQLALFAHTQNPPAWEPLPVIEQQLRLLVNQWDDVQRMHTQVTNRQHSAQRHPATPKALTTSLRRQERALSREMDCLDEAIRRLLSQHPEIKQQIARLKTIPGIGPKTAVRLVAHGGTAIAERSRQALTAHAGLAPRHHQSGTSVHKPSHLDKSGYKPLRQALYMAALTASRCNPTIQPFYERLLQQGKHKKLALAACMRKLLLLAQAVLKHQTLYQANYAKART